MKNVFFSIMVLFMLVASMLGNMNVVTAAIQSVTISEVSYSPQKIILGAGQELETARAIFTVTNDRDTPTRLRITLPSSPTDNSGHTLQSNVVDNDVTYEARSSSQIIVTVTKRQDTVAGTYTSGTIVFTELDVNGNPIDGSSDQKTYSIVVENSNPIVTINGLENNEIVITTEEENVRTKTFTLQNSGNINLNDLTLKLEGGTFTDGTEVISFRAKFGDDNFRILALNTALDMVSDLNAGSSSTIVFEANIPQDIELDNYVGRIIIADTTNANNVLAIVTIPLTIKIEPEICSDGRVANSQPVDGPQSGSGLRITIDNPDRKENFKVNDEISIEVTVENKESKNMDVIVEAVLYDLDKNNRILTVESDSAEVEKNNEKVDFDFIMTVPNDEDIDPDHTYMLYIKAFEDGDEDKYCNYDSVEIDLERENDEVIIDAFTVNPTIVQQGSVVSFRIGAENIGTDEQRDSYIVVKNDELKLNLKSNPFDLKQYDKSGKDRVETFTFTIPVDAVAKDYTIEAVVYYNNERDTASSFGTLTVQAKASEEKDDVVTPSPTTGAGTYVPTKSIFSNLDSTKTLFIIGDIILVILAILFLILIFKKK